MPSSRNERQFWMVQPWFDEGDDYPEEPGTPDRIEAATPEAAKIEYYRLHPNFGSVDSVRVYTEDEWKAQRNG